MSNIRLTDLSPEQLRQILRKAEETYQACLQGNAQGFDDKEASDLRLLVFGVAAKGKLTDLT